MKFLIHSILVIVHLFASSVFANEVSQKNARYAIVGIISKTEASQFGQVLDDWTDREVISFFSELSLADSDIEKLYKNFRDTLFTLSDPTEKEKVTARDLKEMTYQLSKTDKMGRIVHNQLMAMSNKEFKKFGRLVAMMRELLYLDVKHIQKVIKTKEYNNLHWYIVHNGAVGQIDKEYRRLVEKGDD